MVVDEVDEQFVFTISTARSSSFSWLLVPVGTFLPRFSLLLGIVLV